jgi:hypothetical protein
MTDHAHSRPPVPPVSNDKQRKRVEKLPAVYANTIDLADTYRRITTYHDRIQAGAILKDNKPAADEHATDINQVHKLIEALGAPDVPLLATTVFLAQALGQLMAAIDETVEDGDELVADEVLVQMRQDAADLVDVAERHVFWDPA